MTAPATAPNAAPEAGAVRHTDAREAIGGPVGYVV